MLAIVMFIALAPKGYGSADPGQAVMFLVDHQILMRALYQIQYLLFGVSLIFLSLALHGRLQGRPGGRVAYWNMLAHRRRPQRLAIRLRTLDELSARLHRQAMTFFYSGFFVDELA